MLKFGLIYNQVISSFRFIVIVEKDVFSIGRKEVNVLFNDALNSFYLRLYGIRHMVEDHLNNERGNLLLPHGIHRFFYMHHPTDRITDTTAIVTPVVGHWQVREIPQWVYHEGSI